MACISEREKEEDCGGSGARVLERRRGGHRRRVVLDVQVRLGLVGCLSERLLQAVVDLRDAGQSRADFAMTQGLLREPGAWVDTRLTSSGAAPTAALDRARTSFLMPCAEDATAAR